MSAGSGGGGSQVMGRSRQPGPARIGPPGQRRARLVPDLRPGEAVLLLRRRHPAALLSRLAKPLFFLLGWLVSALFVPGLIAGLAPGPLDAPPDLVGRLLPPALLAGWIGVAVIFAVWAAYVLVEWADNWIALTTRRIIVMDKALFFRETRREVPVNRVQNVIADYPNAASVALDYGNLKVDTPGVGVVEFSGVAHPGALREAIFRQQERLKMAQASPDEKRRQAVRGIVSGQIPPVNTLSTPPQGSEIRPYPQALPTAGSWWASVLPPSTVHDGDSVIWRRHWVYLVRSLLGPSLLLGGALGAWALALVRQSGEVAALFGWPALLAVPVAALWALWGWADWRNDLYVIDRERIYDITRLPLGLREQTKQTMISRVSDVMYTVPGPLAHLLDFGHVVLKTPGEATEFLFTGVPHPRQVQGEIMDRVDEVRKRSGESTDREIEAWLKAYYDVQSEGA